MQLNVNLESKKNAQIQSDEGAAFPSVQVILSYGGMEGRNDPQSKPFDHDAVYLLCR